jgi:hypothetical protein
MNVIKPKCASYFIEDIVLWNVTPKRTTFYSQGPAFEEHSEQAVLLSHRGGPGSRTGSLWDLWWTKRHWGRFSPITSVSPANHSTDFSIIIIPRGWHSRPLSGRSVEWTLIPPPTMQIKKIKTVLLLLVFACSNYSGLKMEAVRSYRGSHPTRYYSSYSPPWQP